MNLGKLWATQSRERDALDLLEPLYGRFTEGYFMLIGDDTEVIGRLSRRL